MGNTNDNMCPIRDASGPLSDELATEAFARFFKDKVTNLMSLPVSRPNPIICNGIPPTFSEDEVKEALSNSRPKRSSGPDEIQMSVLKDSAQVMIPLLTKLFNCILKTGIIPYGWKRALVRPVFKKGDPSDIKNYRPISNLSSISKLFERVLLNRLNILYPAIDGINQHGFRANHSTISASLEIQHHLSYFLDKGLSVGRGF